MRDDALEAAYRSRNKALLLCDELQGVSARSRRDVAANASRSRAIARSIYDMLGLGAVSATYAINQWERAKLVTAGRPFLSPPLESSG